MCWEGTDESVFLPAEEIEFEYTDEPSGDVLSTVGLILNVAGVIFVAMWLSIIGGAYRDGSAAMTGIAAVVCTGLSLACFAADWQPRQ